MKFTIAEFAAEIRKMGNPGEYDDLDDNTLVTKWLKKLAIMYFLKI